MKNSAKYIFLSFILVAGVFCVANKAKATPNPPPLEVVSDDPIFTVQNAAPGESFEAEVKIINHTKKKQRFQFEINSDVTPAQLASFVYFKVKKPDGTCLFGCDKNFSLGELNKKEIVIEKIAKHSTNVFIFVLTLDSVVGNEYQGLETKFDITLGYKGKKPVGGANRGGGPAGAGAPPPGFAAGLFRAVTGGVLGETIAAEEIVSGEQVEGAQTGPEEGNVLGEEVSTCQGWPKWVWVLMLIAYFAAFLWRTFSNLSEQIEKRDIRWGWQAVFAAAAFLVWHVFDKCREFWWFVILAMIGGAVIFLLYLYLFRKNIREEHAKVESGSGQVPPENPEPPQAPTSSEE